MEPTSNLERDVTGQSAEGTAFNGSLVRLNCGLAVFEVYNPSLVLRLSDVLSDFEIKTGAKTLYSGTAVVSNLISTATGWMCEVKLDEGRLDHTVLNTLSEPGRPLRDHFGEFLRRWQRQYRIRPEFKETVTDLQSLLADLRLWIEQLELEIRSSPSANREELERKVVDELAEPVTRAIDSFIDRFEMIAQTIEKDSQPVHRTYLRRQLHPYLLCSPFAYRAYHKPLGYAGDYEMVDMMLRSPCEGGSLFAKLINAWLLGQAPARAHRHRITYLTSLLLQETLRLRPSGRPCRVYSLGCGPAVEVQEFLKEHALSNSMECTLLDFNDETLAHAGRILNRTKEAYSRSTVIKFVKRSVQQLLKQSAKAVPRTPETSYEFIYCAGLFDYLPTPVCQRLTNLFYELLAPGGLMVVTNVSDVMNDSRPFRYSMEHILDWHLIYRNGIEMAHLAPAHAPADTVKVIAESSGVNVFMEVRKPAHG